ncbi:MAG: spermidine synthase [Myxococcota bacterium]
MSQETAPKHLRVLIGVGFFLSGMAGLVDQVVWSRYLALFIGSSTSALTVVLATFMGGLAIGNHLFGRRVDATKTHRAALMIYAVLELGIGAWCLLFPEILELATLTYVAAAAPLGFGAPGTAALKLALAAATILPPTILMGGTLPVLARILTTRVADVAADVGRLYFINSFGAAFGAAAAGFWIIPAMGLPPAIRASGAINIALAIAFMAALRGKAGNTQTHSGGDQADAGGDAFTDRQRLVVMVVIGVAGGVSMMYEVVWTRLLSLVMGGSTYSFTIMVTTFITGITLGSLAVSRLFGPGGSGGDPLRWFAIAETGVFLSILPVIPLYDRLPYYFAAFAAFLERTPEAFPMYLGIKVFTAFALMILPTFFIGMTLPLASRVAVDRLAVLGRKVGSIFSVNTLGTVIGASLTGLLIVPNLGLRATLLLGITLSAILALALWSVVPDVTKKTRAMLAGGALALVVGVTALGPWNQLVLHFGMYRHKSFAIATYEQLLSELSHFEVLYAEDGRDTSVAVIKDGKRGGIYMKVNGKTDAGTGGDVSTQLWLGHLGMFLNPAAERVLVIGLGSGITAGSVLAHWQAQVDVIEISEAVVEGAKFFARANGGALEDDRMTLHVGDAKEFFKLQPDNLYDVVVSEPSNPWISGIGNLFSVEYFSEIAAHLRPGGVLVQWVHLYELNDDLFRIIANTIGHVFPHVELWQCNEGDVLLAASMKPISVNYGHVQRLLNDAKVAKDLNRPALNRVLQRPEDFMAGQVLSAGRFRSFFPGEEPLNHDTHPLLEYQAPRAFFANERADLPWRIDERRLPIGANQLHLARSLQVRPPQSEAIDNLLQVLGARGSDADGALLRSIAWAFIAMRDPDEQRQAFARQLADPSLPPAVRNEQATSLFFAPEPALTDDPEAGDASARLAAAARAASPEAVVAVELGDGKLRDPLGHANEALPAAVLKDMHVGQALLSRGQAACAVAPLERALAAAPGAFPIPQLLARAKSLQDRQPCSGIW